MPIDMASNRRARGARDLRWRRCGRGPGADERSSGSPRRAQPANRAWRHPYSEATLTASFLSRGSAAVLLVAGAALLFASDQVLPRLVSGYPATALWLGQLLGAAWLSLAALNWWNRATVLGGIYGRPLVAANMALFLGTSLVLFRAAARPGFPPALWFLAAVTTALSVAYGLLLFRGPLARDLRARGAG